MKRVLLTGMSGTGKSSVVAALAARGFRAVDLDTGGWSGWVRLEGSADDAALDAEAAPDSSADVWRTRDWVWREDRVRRLLSEHREGVLFIAGTSPNQGSLYGLLDHVILLSAPTPVILERLASRTNNPYGKHPDEVARVLGHIDTVVPLLRRSATHEVDTTAPLEDVVETILRLVGCDGDAGRAG